MHCKNGLFVGLTVGLGLLVTACAPFKLKETPPGYAQVTAYSGMAHYKAGDDVGAKVHSYQNVKGGTLAYWSEDLVDKLSMRGYTLVAQSPVQSQNGVDGMRFDFDYVPPGDESKLKFYTVVLFATDAHRVVIELAGDMQARERHDAEAEMIASSLKVRGCNSKKETVCGTPPPADLVAQYGGSPKQVAAEADSADEGEGAGPEAESTPEPEPEAVAPSGG